MAYLVLFSSVGKRKLCVDLSFAIKVFPKMHTGHEAME